MEIDSHERGEPDLDTTDDLDRILSEPSALPSEIDEALRAYLQLAAFHQDGLLPAEDDLYGCTTTFLTSSFYETNREYICFQFIHCFLQEDAPDVIYTLATCLLLEGRRNVELLELMSQEGVFIRLIHCIRTAFRHVDWEKQEPPDDYDGNTVHMYHVEEARVILYRVFLDLTYEMSRVQQIPTEDLVCVDDDFVQHLFQLIEGPAIGDPFHYPVIRVLLVLNEQFLLSLHDRDPNDQSSLVLTNKVIKVLSKFGNKYKTFGENIILFLNRESETSLQLLILKLLYLLFTFPPTYEYFYTNDLRVLVDILIRNLYDLPPSEVALRHTYLRVLHPLLAHTQLRKPGYHYKREELQRLLAVILSTDAEYNSNSMNRHFDGELDETTRRLAYRCCDIEWIADLPVDSKARDKELETGQDKEEDHSPGEDTRSISRDGSAISPSAISPALSNPESTTNNVSQSKSDAHSVLEMRSDSGSRSPHSVLAVANHKEEPGNIISICPDGVSRGALTSSPPPLTTDLPSTHDAAPIVHSKTLPVKVKPAPPMARRSRSRRFMGRQGSVSSINTNNSDISSILETNEDIRQDREIPAGSPSSPDARVDTPTDVSTPPLMGQTYFRYKTGSISSSRSLPMHQQPPGVPPVPIRRTASFQPPPPPPRRSQHPLHAPASVTSSSPLTLPTSNFDQLTTAVHDLHIETPHSTLTPPSPPPPPPPPPHRQHQHQHQPQQQQQQHSASSSPYLHTPSPLSPGQPALRSSPRPLPPDPPVARRSKNRRHTVSKPNP